MNNMELLEQYMEGKLTMPQLLDKLIAANPFVQDVQLIADEYADSMVELDIETAFGLARALDVDLDDMI
jgi:hypothetical protein